MLVERRLEREGPRSYEVFKVKYSGPQGWITLAGLVLAFLFPLLSVTLPEALVWTGIGLGVLAVFVPNLIMSIELGSTIFNPASYGLKGKESRRKGNIFSKANPLEIWLEQ